MSTGGIHVVLGAVNPKSRNGSHRTIAITTSSMDSESDRAGRAAYLSHLPRVLFGLRVLGVDHFRVLHIRSTAGRFRRGLLGRWLVKLLRHRVRHVLELLGRLPDRRQVLALR